MQAIHFKKCNNDEDYEKLTLFLLNHRKEIDDQLDTPRLFLFLGLQSFFGHNIIAVNEQKDVVGAIGYVYGTPKNDYTDEHKIQIDMVFIDEKYRGTFLFYSGLRHLIDELKLTNKTVQEIQFYIPEKRLDLIRLCSKFSKEIKRVESKFGRKILYSAEFRTLCSYVNNRAKLK